MATKFEPGIAYSKNGEYFIAAYGHDLVGFVNKEARVFENQEAAHYKREGDVSVGDLCASWGVKDKEMDAQLEPFFQPIRTEIEPEFSFS